MSASVLHMSMSLDGYIAGPNDDHHNPGGDGFLRGVTPEGEATHLHYRVRKASA